MTNRDHLGVVLDVLLGMLIGGALVFGMTHHELADVRKRLNAACELAAISVSVGDIENRINFSVKEQLAACRGWAPPLEPISGQNPTPPTPPRDHR